MTGERSESIRLYGDWADVFNELRTAVAEERHGIEPGNSELMRMILSSIEADDLTVF